MNALIVGAQGTGKTTLALSLERQSSPPSVYWDPGDDARSLATRVTTAYPPATLARILRGGRRARLVPVRMLRSDLESTILVMLDVAERAGASVTVDEVHAVPPRALDRLADFAVRARHIGPGVSVVVATTHPKNIPRELVIALGGRVYAYGHPSLGPWWRSNDLPPRALAAIPPPGSHRYVLVEPGGSWRIAGVQGRDLTPGRRERYARRGR